MRKLTNPATRWRNILTRIPRSDHRPALPPLRRAAGRAVRQQHRVWWELRTKHLAVIPGSRADRVRDQRRGVLSGCQGDLGDTEEGCRMWDTVWNGRHTCIYCPFGKTCCKGIYSSWLLEWCGMHGVCAVFTVTSNRYASSGPRKMTFRKFKEQCVIVPQRHHTINFWYSLLIFALCSGNMFYIVVIICNLFFTQTLGIDQYYIHKHFNG